MAPSLGAGRGVRPAVGARAGRARARLDVRHVPVHVGDVVRAGARHRGHGRRRVHPVVAARPQRRPDAFQRGQPGPVVVARRPGVPRRARRARPRPAKPSRSRRVVGPLALMAARALPAARRA